MASSGFLDGLNHRDRVARAHTTLATALTVTRRPIVSTKFSPYTGVLLHLVQRLSREIPVVWVDTGYNTRATEQFVQTLCERLTVKPLVFRPIDHIMTVPPGPGEADHEDFVEVVKLEPFRRALEHTRADGWITSVRHHQTAHRQSLSTFSNGAPGVLKISPLLDWQDDDLARYADEHNLPVGPDCYDPTKGEPMRECGLHTVLSA